MIIVSCSIVPPGAIISFVVLRLINIHSDNERKEVVCSDLNIEVCPRKLYRLHHLSGDNRSEGTVHTFNGGKILIKAFDDHHHPSHHLINKLWIMWETFSFSFHFISSINSTLLCELWMNGETCRTKDAETEKKRKFNEQFDAVIAYWFSRLPSRVSQIE